MIPALQSSKMAGLGCQNHRFCDEKLRMGTFTKYPHDVLVRPTRLAEEGFFYGDTINEVTCMRCGCTISVTTLQSLQVPLCQLHFCSPQVSSRRNIPMIASYDAPNTIQECLEKLRCILAMLQSTQSESPAILDKCTPELSSVDAPNTMQDCLERQKGILARLLSTQQENLPLALRQKMLEDHNHPFDASCDINLRRQGRESGSLATRSTDDMSVSGAGAPFISSRLTNADIFLPMGFLSESVRRRSSNRAAPRRGLDGQGIQNQPARPYLNPDLARVDFLISGSGESKKCFLSGNGSESGRKHWTPMFGCIPKPQHPHAYDDDLVFSDADGDETHEVKSLKKRIRKIKEQRLCKVCDANPFDRVFLPCGHLVCCEACASQLQVCPICARPIRSIVPVVPNE